MKTENQSNPNKKILNRIGLNLILKPNQLNNKTKVIFGSNNFSSQNQNNPIHEHLK